MGRTFTVLLLSHMCQLLAVEIEPIDELSIVPVAAAPRNHLQNITRDVYLNHIIQYLNLHDRAQVAQSNRALRRHNIQDPFYIAILRAAGASPTLSPRSTVLASENPKVCLAFAEAVFHSPQVSLNQQKLVIEKIFDFVICRSVATDDRLKGIRLIVHEIFYNHASWRLRAFRGRLLLPYLLEQITSLPTQILVEQVQHEAAQSIGLVPMDDLAPKLSQPQRQTLLLRQVMLQERLDRPPPPLQTYQAYTAFAMRPDTFVSDKLEADTLRVAMRLNRVIDEDQLKIIEAFNIASRVRACPEVSSATRAQADYQCAIMRLYNQVSEQELELAEAFTIFMHVRENPAASAEYIALANYYCAYMRDNHLVGEDQLKLIEAFTIFRRIIENPIISHDISTQAALNCIRMLLTKRVSEDQLSPIELFKLFASVSRVPSTPAIMRAEVNLKLAIMRAHDLISEDQLAISETFNIFSQIKDDPIAATGTRHQAELMFTWMRVNKVLEKYEESFDELESINTEVLSDVSDDEKWDDEISDSSPVLTLPTQANAVIPEVDSSLSTMPDLFRIKNPEANSKLLYMHWKSAMRKSKIEMLSASYFSSHIRQVYALSLAASVQVCYWRIWMRVNVDPLEILRDFSLLSQVSANSDVPAEVRSQADYWRTWMHMNNLASRNQQMNDLIRIIFQGRTNPVALLSKHTKPDYCWRVSMCMNHAEDEKLFKLLRMFNVLSHTIAFRVVPDIDVIHADIDIGISSLDLSGNDFMSTSTSPEVIV